MIILGTNSIKDTGYDVANSLRFNSGSSDSLNRSASAGNRKTFTISSWIKPSTTGYGVFFSGKSASTSYANVQFPNGSSKLQFTEYQNGDTINLETNRLFRDISAWWHVVIAVDTTQGTASNRIKLYLNGVQETSFATETYPSQNADTVFNSSSSTHRIGCNNDADGGFFNGYIAETVLIDGSQLAPDQFGEFDSDSGIWKPIDVSGLTFGTNGFYLDFENSGALGNDAAGSNNFTVNNLTAIDQSTDTCTNNFSTYNPLIVTQSINSTPLFSDGNLKATFNNNSYSLFALSTFAVSSGKWFAEFKMTNISGGSDTYVGVIETEANFSADSSPIDSGTSYRGTGQRVISGSSASYGATYSTGDIIGVALNCDDNEVVFYKNGASQGAVSITADKTYFMWTSDYSSKVIEANFGSPSFSISSGNTDGDGYGNFEYAVPSGYFALNTKNLAEYG